MNRPIYITPFVSGFALDLQGFTHAVTHQLVGVVTTGFHSIEVLCLTSQHGKLGDFKSPSVAFSLSASLIPL